jgi:hypothetical protein
MIFCRPFIVVLSLPLRIVHPVPRIPTPQLTQNVKIKFFKQPSGRVVGCPTLAGGSVGLETIPCPDIGMDLFQQTQSKEISRTSGRSLLRLNKEGLGRLHRRSDAGAGFFETACSNN